MTKYKIFRFSNPQLPSHFPKPWKVDYLISNNWKKAKRKVLLVIDHLPTEDIKNKQIFFEGKIVSLLDQAIKQCQFHKRIKSKDFAFCMVSYNFFKTYNLEPDDENEANRISNLRQRAIIQKLKPTDVHYFGLKIAKEMFNYDGIKSGWIIQEKVEKHNFFFSFNQSITRLHIVDEDEEEISCNKANISGIVCDNLTNCLLQFHPYSLQDTKPKFKLITTIKQFDQLIEKLNKCEYFGYDLETTNLSVYNNAILTMQFTLDTEPDISFIVFCKHKDSPFNKKELIYIYLQMHQFLGKEKNHNSWKGTYIIGQNLAFDLTVSKVEFGIPVVGFRVFDSMAGEHALNENLKYIDTGTEKGAFALDSIFVRYNNDFYQTASFGKSDAKTISDVPLYLDKKLNKPLLHYMAMDTICVVAIHKMQQKRAKTLYNGNENFLPIFKKLMLGIYSDTIHIIATMKQNGLHTDRDYVVEQVFAETSDIMQEKEKLTKLLYKTKPVQKANKRIKRQNALPQGGLFSGTTLEKHINLFDISLQEHQQLLFFDILKLEPLSFTQKGASVDKAFKKFYSKEGSTDFVKEVQLFSSIQESTIAMSFIKKFYTKIFEQDGLITTCIHASYGFANVVTGRTNSFSPSLQQTPNHGQYAKIVKRCFVARPNRINIKMDYATNEINCWSVLTGEGHLASTFRKIWNIKLKFRKNPTKKNQKMVDLADLHKINYNTFTNTPVKEVTEIQRNQSKTIGFSVIFGKSVNSLARDLNTPIDEMQKIFAHFFQMFDKEKAWIDTKIKEAQDNLVVYNSFGLRRNLQGYLVANQGTRAALNRKAVNSPIQGLGSQFGFVAARMLQIKMHHSFIQQGLYGKPKFDSKIGRIITRMPDFGINSMVHDSNEVDCSYDLVPLVLPAMEYCATNGLIDYTKKMYGIKWIIRPQIDFEIGDKGDSFYSWNFTQTTLENIIDQCVKSSKSRGFPVSKKQIQRAKVPTKQIQKMQQNFPLDLTPFKETKR